MDFNAAQLYRLADSMRSVLSHGLLLLDNLMMLQDGPYQQCWRRAKAAFLCCVLSHLEELTALVVMCQQHAVADIVQVNGGNDHLEAGGTQASEAIPVQQQPHMYCRS